MAPRLTPKTHAKLTKLLAPGSPLVVDIETARRRQRQREREYHRALISLGRRIGPPLRVVLNPKVLEKLRERGHLEEDGEDPGDIGTLFGFIGDVVGAGDLPTVATHLGRAYDGRQQDPLWWYRAHAGTATAEALVIELGRLAGAVERYLAEG
jgi:hypothetical protein